MEFDKLSLSHIVIITDDFARTHIGRIVKIADTINEYMKIIIRVDFYENEISFEVHKNKWFPLKRFLNGVELKITFISKDDYEKWLLENNTDENISELEEMIVEYENKYCNDSSFK